MHLSFVGAMTGAHPGKVITQAELLARLFRDQGYRITLISSHPNRYVRLAEISWALWRRCRDVDVHMLQVFSGRSFVVEDVATRIAQRSDKPVVATLRGGNLPRFARRFPRWTGRVLGRAAALVVPSRYLQRSLEWLGLPFEVIPNVVDIPRYTFHERSRLRPRLLWMRSFHAAYNPELAVHVLARISLQVPDATLTMAGPDIGLKARTERLVHELGLGQRVRFVGLLNTEAKARAGKDHDVYLNTTRIDNMPVSVLEMAAMGMPVVSTAVGGIPDLLVDGETGLLTPPDDPRGMADRVVGLLGDPALANRLSRNGRNLALESSWDKVGPRWEALLRQVRGT